jgi:hypothetical protein
VFADVSVTGGALLSIRVWKFTGPRDEVRAQFEERLALLRQAVSAAVLW